MSLPHTVNINIKITRLKNSYFLTLYSIHKMKHSVFMGISLAGYLVRLKVPKFKSVIQAPDPTFTTMNKHVSIRWLNS